MGGKMSRRKGLRTEYILRDYLRERGYLAERVPLSGASAGFKGDVVAKKDDTEYLFEMKARKDEFKKIYILYYKYRKENKVHRFGYSSSGPFVEMSSDFEALLDRSDVLHNHFTNLLLVKPEPFEVRTYSKILRMYEFVKGCQFLVLKDNNKPMLFLRYWV